MADLNKNSATAAVAAAAVSGDQMEAETEMGLYLIFSVPVVTNFFK